MAETFVGHLTDRAWVLREIEADRFEFTHRTVYEYFFALHLTKNMKNFQICIP